jgi:hypothetical protein
LLLQQSCFKQDHAQSEHIIFIRIFIDDWSVIGNSVTLFGRQIDALIVTITEDVLQIGGKTATSGVCHLNITVLLEEHCLTSQAFMPNRVLLHGGQRRHAASDQAP